jgi:hypothetical protein
VGMTEDSETTIISEQMIVAHDEVTRGCSYR